MSITDELREFIDSLACHKDTRDMMRRIADRIDAEHQKAIRELNNLADASVLLPVDADGVPIRVGDTVKAYGETPIYVLGIGMVAREEDSYHGVFTQGMDGRYEWFNARFLHHVKPDSWERIIEDALTVGWQNGNWSEVASAEIHDRLVERCRRLAGERG